MYIRHFLNIVTYLLQQLLYTLLLDGLAVTHCYQLPLRVVPLCDSFLNILICTVQPYTFCTLNLASLLGLGVTTRSVLFPVLVGQCWQLLSCRQPVLVAQADCLPMGCSGLVCGPPSSTIFLANVSLKSLCEILELWDCRRMWLFRIVRLK
jgi:hypothetical protein